MGKSCATNREIGEIVGKVQGRVGLPRLVLGRMRVTVAPRARSVVVKEGIVHGSMEARKAFVFRWRQFAPKGVTHLRIAFSRDSDLKLT